MASEDYVAIKSEQLSAAAREERYVMVNRWTREVVDNCNGHGYKSAQSAHKSWAYKQRQRNQRPGGQQGWRSSYRTAADSNGVQAPQQQCPQGRLSYPYSTPRRRPQDVSQENTPPPPDLFDFQNK